MAEQKVEQKVKKKVSDTWNAKLSNTHLIIEGDLMAKITNDRTWYTAFGLNTYKKGDKKLWKITIQKSKSLPNIIIGIVNKENISPKMNGHFCDFKNGEHGYGFHSKDQKIIHYGSKKPLKQRLLKGKSVIVELDLKGKYGALNYYFNASNAGGFDKIDLNKEYVLAVSMFEQTQIGLDNIE